MTVSFPLFSDIRGATRRLLSASFESQVFLFPNNLRINSEVPREFIQSYLHVHTEMSYEENKCFFFLTFLETPTFCTQIYSESHIVTENWGSSCSQLKSQSAGQVGREVCFISDARN